MISYAIHVKGHYMSEGQNPGDRLKWYREEVASLQQRTFATQLGLTGGVIGQIETGRTQISRNVLDRLSDVFRVNPAWILEGRYPMVFDTLPGFEARRSSRIEPPNYDAASPGDFSKDSEDYVMIKRYDLSVSAGTGLEAVEHGERERLAFSRSWLRRNSLNPNLSVLVRVQGDSMTPTIPDGCLVLLHVFEMEVKKEGIYAYIRHGEAFVKRMLPINTSKDGRATSLVILSDNSAYSPDVLVGDQLNEIRIVGRVRCAMTTF